MDSRYNIECRDDDCGFSRSAGYCYVYRSPLNARKFAAFQRKLKASLSMPSWVIVKYLERVLKERHRLIQEAEFVLKNRTTRPGVHTHFVSADSIFNRCPSKKISISNPILNLLVILIKNGNLNWWGLGEYLGMVCKGYILMMQGLVIHAETSMHCNRDGSRILHMSTTLNWQWPTTKPAISGFLNECEIAVLEFLAADIVLASWFEKPSPKINCKSPPCWSLGFGRWGRFIRWPHKTLWNSL